MARVGAIKTMELIADQADERGPRGEGEEVRNRQHYSNDDKSPLINLLNCIVCSQTMKIEKSSPDADGMDIIQYRCGRCDRIERVRLFRRTRDALG
jgi:hypothetical protein